MDSSFVVRRAKKSGGLHMRKEMFKAAALTAATVLGLSACSSGSMPTGTSPAAAPAQQADRQLLSVDSMPNAETFQLNAQQLPESISLEDAETMLMQIDPSQVKETKPGYSL